MKDYEGMKLILNRCFNHSKYCEEALLKINNYQKSAAIKQKFPCQTRLLGLEANVIMAMNSNLKKKDAKRIFAAVKKYC